MEGQRLLWIVLSVVLFVVVVLASALYFLKPQGTQPALAGISSTGTSFDMYEYVRSAPTQLPVETPTEPLGPEVMVGEAAEPPAATTPVVAPAPAPAPAVVQRVAPASRAPAATQPARPAARPAARPTPTPAPATPTRLFWIQTASFRSRTGAEAMAADLTQKGIAGRLQVRDVNGKPYYRVRVGPYTTRQEAEKFLAWIKAVDGLEQSYISVVDP